MNIKIVLGLAIYAAVISLFAAEPTYATTSAACFEYTITSGNATITNYLDNEGNDPGNPACSRDVEIPDQLGGANVTRIGDLAFSGKNLTSLALPSALQSIGDFSFQSNQLGSVVIPNSVRGCRGSI